MRCSLPPLWLGMGLVTMILTGGCQHARQCPTNCYCPPVAPNAIAYKPPQPRPKPARKPAADEFATLPPRTDQPVMHTTAKPAPLSLDAAPSNASALAGTEPAAGSSPKSSSREALASPPANADLVPQSRYGHDPNYHRLAGVLEYSKIQDAWVLRYAPVEEEDRYGGSVTLHGSGPLTAFKNRQQVRVEGHVINPDSQQIRPAFEVESIHPAQP